MIRERETEWKRSLQIKHDISSFRQQIFMIFIKNTFYRTKLEKSPKKFQKTVLLETV
jgi:hypothetical protein